MSLRHYRQTILRSYLMATSCAYIRVYFIMVQPKYQSCRMLVIRQDLYSSVKGKCNTSGRLLRLFG